PKTRPKPPDQAPRNRIRIQGKATAPAPDRRNPDPPKPHTARRRRPSPETAPTKARPLKPSGGSRSGPRQPSMWASEQPSPHLLVKNAVRHHQMQVIHLPARTDRRHQRRLRHLAAALLLTGRSVS